MVDSADQCLQSENQWLFLTTRTFPGTETLFQELRNTCILSNHGLNGLLQKVPAPDIELSDQPGTTLANLATVV